MEDYIGEVRMFAGNFAPRNWAFCEGQTLSIADNQALFAIIGTIYGGDGRTTFRLPDLRGRIPLGPGTGPGLSTRRQGEAGGTENNTIETSQMAPHNHPASIVVKPQASTAAASEDTPTNNFLAGTENYTEAANTTMGDAEVTAQIGDTGGGQPMNNMQPFLGMHFIICINGLFPSRN